MFANSRHLVLARIKTPKNSYKIPGSAVSDTLLMSGFQKFAADTSFQNRAPRDFFTHPTKKNALSFQIFPRKSANSSVSWALVDCEWRAAAPKSACRAPGNLRSRAQSCTSSDLIKQSSTQWHFKSHYSVCVNDNGPSVIHRASVG